MFEKSNTDIKYITFTQFEKLLKGAKKTRNPKRNHLIVMMMYRHGLRETELCNLRLEQVKLEQGLLQVKRIKKGRDSVHPIEGDELRFIKSYLRAREKNKGSGLPYLFLSEQGNQLHRNTVINTIKQASKQAGLGNISPHMLRHGCGFYLASKDTPVRVIQEYLGHVDIDNTVIYTEISGKKFEGLFN